jgi:CubicO group peptidase (beta-lactamase class C family)
MATPHFPADISASLRQLLDTTTSGPTPSVAGLVYCAVGRNGDILFNHASGSRGLSPFNADPMTLDTVFWMASCTKMITGIACMQLVEQGRLSLDDLDQIERITPELRHVKVLEGDPKRGFRLVEKQRGITLRMLLNHTGIPPFLRSLYA